jgi:predicted dehydrogenase
MASKAKPVRLAIIGTGGMANSHASAFAAIPGVSLVAGVDVDPARAAAFATKHSIPQSFPSLEALLASGLAFDAVTNVTPDRFHAPVSLAALKAGKHVLCEKPLAVDHAEALRMVKAAHAAGVVHMVNFSYRNWSAIQGIARAVERGVLGELRHIEASYLQAWLVSNAWGDWRKTPAWLWRLSSQHGSKGALGDVGVHIVDFATFPCGPISEVFCRLKAFPKAPGDRLGEYPLDANDSAVLNVVFANGALGTIHTTRWCGGHANRLSLKIAGTKGTIDFDSERSTTAYRVCKGQAVHTAAWETVEVKPTPSNYERFIRAIRTGKPEQPDFDRGAQVQRVLDACFASDAAGKPIRLS